MFSATKPFRFLDPPAKLRDSNCRHDLFNYGQIVVGSRHYYLGPVLDSSKLQVKEVLVLASELYSQHTDPKGRRAKVSKEISYLAYPSSGPYNFHGLEMEVLKTGEGAGWAFAPIIATMKEQKRARDATL